MREAPGPHADWQFRNSHDSGFLRKAASSISDINTIYSIRRMDGGRIGASLVKPKVVDADELPDISPSILRFRRIVNEFKRLILGVTDNKDNLEVGKKRIQGLDDAMYSIQLLNKPTNEKADIQELDSLQDALSTIQHLSNVLKAILMSDVAILEKHRDVITRVKDVFTKNGFNFEGLDNETKRDCLHFIKIDIDMYPYDLNPGHIISVSKTGSQ